MAEGATTAVANAATNAAKQVANKVTNMIPKKSMVGLAIFIVFALVVTGIVVFLIFWVFKSKSDGGVKQDQLIVSEDKGSASNSKTQQIAALATSTANKYTYTIVCNITDITPTTNAKIILSRGKDSSTPGNQYMILFLDKDTNDLMLAFKNNTTMGSWYEKMCIFKIENVPIYRWCAIHIVQDMDQNVAKVYIDGKLRKVCNLFACSSTVSSLTTTGTPYNHFSVGYVLDTNATSMSTGTFAQYGIVYVRTRDLSASDVASEADALVSRITEWQKQWNMSNVNSDNTCSAQQ